MPFLSRYCDNVMDKELNKTTIELLQKLVIFQDRQYHKDPVKVNYYFNRVRF